MYFALLHYHFCCTIRGETTLILELSEGENLEQVHFSWKLYMFLGISFVIRTCKHKDKATYFNECQGQLLSLFMCNLHIHK